MRLKGWTAETVRACAIAILAYAAVCDAAIAEPDPAEGARTTQPLDLRPSHNKRPIKTTARETRSAPVSKVAAKKHVPAKGPVKGAAAIRGEIPKLVLREPGPAKPLVTDAPSGGSESSGKAEAPKAASVPETKISPDAAVIAQFCNALSPAASDGRLAWQARRMEELEAKLRDRIAELEAKRAETAEWLKRREEALKMADEAVVAIYSKMKPDAAAAQFSAMDESGAAAILMKLNPRAAGTVLNEIEAGRAARIAAEMAGVGARRDVARSVQ
jgi:flagellar motility protein MotE (MotC chaperone)